MKNHSVLNHLSSTLYYMEVHGVPVIIDLIKHFKASPKDSSHKFFRVAFSFFILVLFTFNIHAKELYLGATTVDITPTLPVALDGQMHLRIAQKSETPLEASIVVLESREGNRSIESAIFVSCDLVVIPLEMFTMVKNEVQRLLPEFDVSKIVMNATHTHTGPVIRKEYYPIPEKGVTQIEDYYSFFARNVGGAIIEAWNSRSIGSITWGLSYAKIGHNRRAVYADGSAQMYGKTDLPEFRYIEGPEDQNINTLFLWDKSQKLIAVSINLACTSQEVENRSTINADFWYPVRIALRQRFGTGLCVSGWISAAGDQSPHLMLGSAGENRMLKLRNLDRMEEIARRIVLAVEDAYDAVSVDHHSDITLKHVIETISLPMRVVTEIEYEQSKKEIEKLKAQMDADPKTIDRVFRRLNWEGGVLRRYEEQRTNSRPMYETEIHVIRIGDVVVCTNPFELFTDYGIAIQARSKSVQTFIVQLTGPGTYLPTEKAVRGGGYSAIVESNLVGPEGGQILVDRTVKLISDLFSE